MSQALLDEGLPWQICEAEKLHRAINGGFLDYPLENLEPNCERNERIQMTWRFRPQNFGDEMKGESHSLF